MKKTLTGNKTILKHEELLVDKTLIRRISSAKSTIKNKNTHFEKKLQNRNNKPIKYPLLPVNQNIDFQPTSYFASRPLTITQLSQNTKDQTNSQNEYDDDFENFEFQNIIVQEQQYDNESIMCNFKSPLIKKNKTACKKK